MKQSLNIFLGITASSTIFTLLFFRSLDQRIAKIQKIISEEREKTIQLLDFQKNDIKQIFIKQREETFIQLKALIKEEKKNLLFNAHNIVSELKPNKIWEKVRENASRKPVF